MCHVIDMPVLSMFYSEVDWIIGMRGGTAWRWINGYGRRGKAVRFAPLSRFSHYRVGNVGRVCRVRVRAELQEEIPTRWFRTAVKALWVTYRIDLTLAHLRPSLSAQNREPTIGGVEVGID